MKKIIILTILIAALLFAAQTVYAQTGLGAAMGNLDKATKSTGLSKDLPTTVGTVINGALALVGTVFLILMVYAGILWMTAQGEQEKVEKAQKIIKACIIGLFITMSAYAITFFVTTKLGGNAPGTGSGQGTPIDPYASEGPGLSSTGCNQLGGLCFEPSYSCDPPGTGNDDPYSGSNFGICNQKNSSNQNLFCCELKESTEKCGYKGGTCLPSCAQGQQEIGSCDKSKCCKN